MQLTAEWTRRREFIQASPDQLSYETRFRRSRPTICSVAYEMRRNSLVNGRPIIVPPEYFLDGIRDAAFDPYASVSYVYAQVFKTQTSRRNLQVTCHGFRDAWSRSIDFAVSPDQFGLNGSVATVCRNETLFAARIIHHLNWRVRKER